MSLVCNIAEAQRFIDLLRTTDTDKTFNFVTLQEIADNEGKKFILEHTGELDYYKDKFCMWNDKGMGIFVAVNRMKGKRSKENTTMCRAIWQDDDGGAIVPDLEPSIVVETSPGKYHRYWLIERGTDDFFSWSRMMKAMAEKYHHDKAATDLPRIMRVPGFYHQKDKPFQVRIVNDVTPQTVKRYTWQELCSYFLPTPHFKGEESTLRSKYDDAVDAFDPEQAIDDVMHGRDFHESLNSIAMSFVNRGYKEGFIIKMLQNLMLASPENGTKRWQERMNDIPRAIKTAFSRYALEQEEDVTPVWTKPEGGEAVLTLDRPPGMMGKITAAAETMVRYPSLVLAIETALHAVNTFAGNYYTFDDAPNHRKTIILAAQGRGKNTPNRFMNHIIDLMVKEHPNAVGFYNFMGSPDFTSAKNIHLELQEWGSRSIITPEAGHAKASRSGDLDRLKAYENQLLGAHPGEMISPVRQNTARGETRTKPLKSVCVSLIQESVPSNYAALLADGHQYADGTMSRANFVFIDKEDLTAGKIQQSNKGHISDEVIECLYKIADNAATKGDITHRAIIPDMLAIECDKEVTDYLLKLEIFNITQKGKWSSDMVLESIYTRRTTKIKATARLLAVVDNPDNPRVTMEHVKWAEHHQEQLDACLLHHANTGVLSNTLERVVMKYVDVLQEIMIPPMGSLNAAIQKSVDQRNKIVSNGVIGYIYRERLGRGLMREVEAMPRYRYKESRDIVQSLTLELCERGVLREEFKKPDGSLATKRTQVRKFRVLV